MTWRAIAGFRLVTRQFERLVPFYEALGFAAQPPVPIADPELALLGIAGAGMRIAMRLGNTTVDLDSYTDAGRPYPPAITGDADAFQHLALPTQTIDEAWRRAEAAGARPISRDGPVALPPASGGVVAVKFRDPEGHPLELIGLPADAGDGVNHSAIVATDLDASLRFYAAAGLIERGRTLNVGPAQQRLDDVADAEVDVVPLYPATPAPHLELLHYRRPGPRIPPPAVNDAAATRILWRADRTAVVRDPDGHLHQLTAASA